MGEYDHQWYEIFHEGNRRVVGWGYGMPLKLEEIDGKTPQEIFAKGRAFGTLEEKIRQLALAMELVPKQALGNMADELRDMYHDYIDIAEALKLPIRADVYQVVSIYLDQDAERLRFVQKHPDKEHLLDHEHQQSMDHEPPITHMPR